MKKKKHGFKYWIGKLHLILGLASGLIVFIVSITGCIFVFQDEIKDAIHDYRKVAVENKPFLQPSELKAKALTVYPRAAVNRIVLFDKGRPATVLLKQDKDFFFVYLNPYSGQVLHHENLRSDFFIIIQYLHMYLLLPKPIGQPIVDVAVIIFVVMLITGIILWWPKNRQERKQSFRIRFNARWRRVNYDLHRIPGFYACIIALIIAITGLSMSYDWVKDALYKTVNLGKAYPDENRKAPLSDTTAIAGLPLDSLINKAYVQSMQASPNSQMAIVFMPAKKEAAINVTTYAKQLRFYERCEFTFDQYTGKLIRKKPHAAKSAGAKLNAMNYDLHTGQVLGFAGKLIAFLASLVAASLPITGFLLWRGRVKKKKKAASLAA